MSFAYCTLMEKFFNRFVFCLLLHLSAMEKVAPVPLFGPSCKRIFYKNGKVWVSFKNISSFRMLTATPQDLSEVHPIYGFRNVFLSKNFYFFLKNPKMVVFRRKISQYLVT